MPWEEVVVSGWWLVVSGWKDKISEAAGGLPQKGTKSTRAVFLNWHTVKELDKQYMAEQLRRAGCPTPTVIGIDEMSIGPGHTYRIIVSDLLRGRPIWF